MTTVPDVIQQLCQLSMNGGNSTTEQMELATNFETCTRILSVPSKAHFLKEIEHQLQILSRETDALQSPTLSGNDILTRVGQLFDELEKIKLYINPVSVVNVQLVDANDNLKYMLYVQCVLFSFEALNVAVSQQTKILDEDESRALIPLGVRWILNGNEPHVGIVEPYEGMRVIGTLNLRHPLNMKTP